MGSCKALIRTSLSCLELIAGTQNSTVLRHFPSSLSLLHGSGMMIKTHQPFSVSRSLGYVKAAAVSNNTEGTSPNSLSKANVVKALISKDKDDISRLMKMERRPENKDNLERCRWFPYLDKVKAGDVYVSSEDVLGAMEPHIMDTRKERFKNAVNNRSYSVCLVVEGLSDFGNVSAAFRSAEALGFQSVHVISRHSSKRYIDNHHVGMGAEKWLDIEHWSSVKECFGVLKSRGYRIATAHLGSDASVSVYDIDWSCPTAIVVGNENSGISSEALELSDIQCSIPMNGMVESLNVSVAAGLLMHQAVCDRTLRMGSHGDLTQEERKILLAEFYLRHNEIAIKVANEFYKRKYHKK